MDASVPAPTTRRQAAAAVEAAAAAARVEISSAAGVGVVDARTYGALALCAAAGISRTTLRRLRAEGIVTPVAGPARGPRYDAAALGRARTARRLMRDLGVNLAGAAVALHLLDELAAARSELAAVLAGRGAPDSGAR